MRRAVKIYGSLIQFKVPNYLAEGVEETARRLNVSPADLLRYLLDVSLFLVGDKDPSYVHQLVTQRQIDLTHKQTEIDRRNRNNKGTEPELVASFSDKV